MKKKIIGGIAIMAIAIAAAFNLNLNKESQDLSMLSLANVDALASESTSKKYDCYSILNGSGQSISCSSCQMDSGTPPWYHFGSKCTR